MEPFEMLLSESQERMLAIVRPEDVEEAVAVCTKWEVLATPIGTVKPGANLTVVSRGEVVADVPARSLADDGPTYHRPMARPVWIDELNARDPLALPAPADLGRALLDLLASPNICSKRWVYEQYDSIVQHNTLAGPGGDAAVIRIEGTSRALAISTDGNGRYCQLDPRVGTMLAVAESARNVACAGGRPVAVTNCLNFGNPEDAQVMWQFSESVAGLGEACRALGTPVTGGNVSFYNKTDEVQIHPTPVIGMVGILEDVSHRVGVAWNEGDAIVVLGETRAELGGSEWTWAAHDFLGGLPPSIDLAVEGRLVNLLWYLARRGTVTAAHDCSEGGLGVTLAECAVAAGVGARIEAATGDLAPHVWLFSETGARAVVATRDPDEVLRAAEAAGVPARALGSAGGNVLDIPDILSLDVAALREAYEGTFPALMR